METTPRTAYKAIIKSAPSKILPKANGAQYVLMSAEITEGPAKGVVVTATRTVLTKDSVTKETPDLNQEVTLYHSIIPSTKEGEKNAHFFEISLGNETASNNELDKVFGL